MLFKIDALIGELNTAKSNITKAMNSDQNEGEKETAVKMATVAQLNSLPKKSQEVLKKVVN